MGKARHPVVTGRTLTLRIGIVVDNPGQLAIITIRRLLSPVVGPGRLVDHYLDPLVSTLKEIRASWALQFSSCRTIRRLLSAVVGPGRFVDHYLDPLVSTLK